MKTIEEEIVTKLISYWDIGMRSDQTIFQKWKRRMKRAKIASQRKEGKEEQVNRRMDGYGRFYLYLY